MVSCHNSLYTNKKQEIMKPRKPYPHSRLNKIIKIAKQIRNKELYGNSLNKWNLLQHIKKHSN